MRNSKQSDGDVQVDLGRYELRRFGRRIKIEKKPMELLIFLPGVASRWCHVRRLSRSYGAPTCL